MRMEHPSSRRPIIRPAIPASPLDARHLPAALALLERDPVAHTFLLDRLDRHGCADGSWFGAGDPLSAVVFAPPSALPRIFGSCMPTGSEEGCRAVGGYLRDRGLPYLVLGATRAVRACWQGLGRPLFRVQQPQRLMGCSTPTPGPALAVRRARPDDAPFLVQMHADLLTVELSLPPGRLDPDGQRSVIDKRIAAGTSWVAEVDDAVAFCADVGTCGPRGAQVGGIFVQPRLRGRAIGQRALRALLDQLQAPHVSLHVGQENAPAIRCYRKVGFEPAGPVLLMTW